MDAVRVAFGWLCSTPHPVTLDTTGIGWLPDGELALDDLADRLRSRRCPRPTRDRVWARLVTRSRAEGSTWTLACAGVALPMLISVAARLTDRVAADRAEVDAAVLTGFLTGLERVDLDRPGILVSLRWRAFRAGLTALRGELDAPVPTPTPQQVGRPSAPVGGHPDLVLARATALGVITAAEAELIGATRLDGLTLADAATGRGVSYPAIRQARSRAERRLRDYLIATDPRPTPVARPPDHHRTRAHRSHPVTAAPLGSGVRRAAADPRTTPIGTGAGDPPSHPGVSDRPALGQVPRPACAARRRPEPDTGAVAAPAPVDPNPAHPEASR